VDISYDKLQLDSVIKCLLRHKHNQLILLQTLQVCLYLHTAVQAIKTLSSCRLFQKKLHGQRKDWYWIRDHWGKWCHILPHKEAYDIIEQAPVLPHQGVCEVNQWVSQKQVSTINMDNSSDEFISNPLAPWEVSKWGQLMSGTKVESINSVVVWMAKDRTWHLTYKWRLNSIVFNVVFCSCYHFTGRVEQINTTNNTWTSWWQTSSTWCNWIWNVSISSDYCSNGLQNMRQLGRYWFTTVIFTFSR
jgi:hypothetical protein